MALSPGAGLAAGACVCVCSWAYATGAIAESPIVPKTNAAAAVLENVLMIFDFLA
jgi:hypothetical protein